MCQTPITADAASGLVAKAIGQDQSSSTEVNAKRRRLKIWETRHNCQCSIVGTCLSQGDLERLLRKCRLVATSDMTPYGLHGYFTVEVSKDCPLAKAVQKLLDKRYSGMIRTVSRIDDPVELFALWQREYDAGRIAGIYWALQTHAHIPDALHIRIFGEVHMLSHVLGRTVHATAAKASEIQARAEDLEEKLIRHGQRHKHALRERDARIEQLERECVNARQQITQTPKFVHQAPHRALNNTKQDRALASARARARAAEARAVDLQQKLQSLRQSITAQNRSVLTAANEQGCPGAEACRLELAEGENLKVLYLGGRSGSVARLRSIAETASAEFIHHDGGKEQAFNRINGLISQCHVVFCPLDCISHRACLYAKDRCRRLDKSFIPLPSAGGSTFARALDQLDVA